MTGVDELMISERVWARVIGRTLAKFNQLKRNKGFDNLILMVWVQGSPFHIAVGSHPVQEAWGSQNVH